MDKAAPMMHEHECRNTAHTDANLIELLAMTDTDGPSKGRSLQSEVIHLNFPVHHRDFTRPRNNESCRVDLNLRL